MRNGNSRCLFFYILSEQARKDENCLVTFGQKKTSSITLWLCDLQLNSGHLWRPLQDIFPFKFYHYRLNKSILRWHCFASLLSSPWLRPSTCNNLTLSSSKSPHWPASQEIWPVACVFYHSYPYSSIFFLWMRTSIRMRDLSTFRKCHLSSFGAL